MNSLRLKLSEDKFFFLHHSAERASEQMKERKEEKRTREEGETADNNLGAVYYRVCLS